MVSVILRTLLVNFHRLISGGLLVRLRRIKQLGKIHSNLAPISFIVSCSLTTCFSLNSVSCAESDYITNRSWNPCPQANWHKLLKKADSKLHSARSALPHLWCSENYPQCHTASDSILISGKYGHTAWTCGFQKDVRSCCSSAEHLKDDKVSDLHEDPYRTCWKWEV